MVSAPSKFVSGPSYMVFNGDHDVAICNECAMLAVEEMEQEQKAR